jgi:predicted esterase
MKNSLLITFLCVHIFMNVSAQFDERFYFPSKEYENIEDINYEDMYFDIDTIRLHGIFLKPDSTANTTIIFYIGSGGNTASYTPIAKPLVHAGYQVFMINPRGYGKSTGIPTHINIASDAQIVLDSILKKEEIKGTRIIIYGASMGTQIAVKIAKDNQDNIDGLILDGPMSSFTDIAIASSPEEQKEVIEQYVTSPYAAKDDIKDIKNMPKLIIHSKEDESIPFIIMQINQKQCGFIKENILNQSF